MPAEEQRSGGHALWCEAVLFATMNLITVKSRLKMLSLSVNRWDFTDKWNKTQSSLHSFRCS